MIKIKEIKGFKYIGECPPWVDNPSRHSNFRKNLTYMKLRFSNWEKDKYMLDFIGEHVNSISSFSDWIQEHINSGFCDIQKDVHIIIRQDDDNPELRGQEVVILSNKKPRNVDSYILKNKKMYTDFENEDLIYSLYRQLEFKKTPK